MGLITTALKLGLWGATGGVASVGVGAAYLAASTTLVDLTKDDPLFKSKTYAKYNPKGNPALQDVVIKRVPLRKIKPELRDNEEALTLEFCRGIWSRWGMYLETVLRITMGIVYFSPYPLYIYINHEKHRFLPPKQVPREV